MRIAQIVLPNASEYERKCQRADHAALSGGVISGGVRPFISRRAENERSDPHPDGEKGRPDPTNDENEKGRPDPKNEKGRPDPGYEVVVVPVEGIGDLDADVAHLYAGAELPAAVVARCRVPYVSSAGIRASRWSWRKPIAPRAIVSPLGEEPLPEVVEERYFVDAGSRDSAVKIVGSFDRPSVRNSVEQTLARIARFRTDVEWQIHRAPPSPKELSAVDLWVDPAVDESDFDGFVAEAQVVGLPVVATRTPINVLRLEKGRTGFLTPPRDPNEMTHAILTALFKSEVAQSRQLAARQTVSKFRARQRLRILTRIYETLMTTTP